MINDLLNTIKVLDLFQFRIFEFDFRNFSIYALIENATWPIVAFITDKLVAPQFYEIIKPFILI